MSTLHTFKKEKWGDRPDGRWIKGTGLQTIMANVMPNRTDSEVCYRDLIDATELVKFLEKRNAEHPEFKTTVFHCVLLVAARIIRERPYMNRFIQGRRMYERHEISLSFVAKRRFADGAEEALLVVVPKEDETIDSLSRYIVGDVTEMRKSEHSTGGVDAIMDALAKLPRPILMFVVKLIRILDFWGRLPHGIWETDPNYTTVLAANLGSIRCPSVYHHLNNYGTNSIMVTIGTLHKEELVMEDGHKELRDVIDLSATLDERIADGFYFARSLKLVKYVFAHPELLDQPLNIPSGFDYK